MPPSEVYRWWVCEDSDEPENPYVVDDFVLSESAIKAVRRLHELGKERAGYGPIEPPPPRTTSGLGDGI